MAHPTDLVSRAAERQRHFRERRDSDPIKRQHYLQISEARHQHDLQTGKKKLVKEMSVAGHKMMKEKWTLDKQRERKRVRKRR